LPADQTKVIYIHFLKSSSPSHLVPFGSGGILFLAIWGHGGGT
jgi:hypothetical protein